MINKSHKIKLNPTKAQMVFLDKSFGTARFTYNWALNKWNEDYGKIVIEDLNIKAMKKNRKLSQAISDVGFGEFRRQLEYKSIWYGSEVIIANRFYPSSKICSCCGNKKEVLKLSERVYACALCGVSIDRDLNASKNLAKFALLGNPEEVKLGGDLSSIVATQFSESMKQELLFINF